MDIRAEKKAYIDAILVNLFSIQKKCELLTIPIVALPFIYFLINESYIETIDVAYFSIKQEKLRLILVLIPSIYALSIISYLLYSLNRNQLSIDYKKGFYDLNNEKDKTLQERMIQNLLPFNIWFSLSNITQKNDTWVDAFLGLLMVPLLSLLFLPIWFSYYTCARIYTEFWNISLLSKISFIITIWIWLVIVLFMIKLFIEKFHKNKFSS